MDEESKTQTTVAEHNYQDLSGVPEKVKKVIAKGGVKEPFPIKLFKLLQHIDLEENNYAQYISWQPHGRCFRIHSIKGFKEHILPKFFVNARYESFRRQLNLWGFKRITRSGPDQGSYYHIMFLRTKFYLCHDISRTAVLGQGRIVPNPEAEPDFISMPQLPPSSALNSHFVESRSVPSELGSSSSSGLCRSRIYESEGQNFHGAKGGSSSSNATWGLVTQSQPVLRRSGISLSSLDERMRTLGCEQSSKNESWDIRPNFASVSAPALNKTSLTQRRLKVISSENLESQSSLTNISEQDAVERENSSCDFGGNMNRSLSSGAPSLIGGATNSVFACTNKNNLSATRIDQNLNSMNNVISNPTFSPRRHLLVRNRGSHENSSAAFVTIPDESKDNERPTRVAANQQVEEECKSVEFGQSDNIEESFQVDRIIDCKFKEVESGLHRFFQREESGRELMDTLHESFGSLSLTNLIKKKIEDDDDMMHFSTEFDAKEIEFLTKDEQKETSAAIEPLPIDQ